MKVHCPHCQHGHEFVAAPGRHVLKCSACRRSFPYETPEVPEPEAPRSPREEKTERVGPVAARLAEKTVIVQLPAAQPSKPAAEPAPRSRTGERKAVAKSVPTPPPVAQPSLKAAEAPVDPNTQPGAPSPFTQPGAPSPFTQPGTPSPFTQPGAPSPFAAVPETAPPLEADQLPTARTTPFTDTDLEEEGPRVLRPEERTVMVKAPQAPAPDVPWEQGEVTPRPAPAPRKEAEERKPPVTELKRAPTQRRIPVSRPAASPRPGTGSRRAVSVPPLPPPVPRSEPDEESSLVELDTRLEEGMKLGGYQLLRRIGAGSMGTVWLARQLSLDRDVALKVLRPSLSGDPQFVYRFTQEAFAAAQLVHHHIVQIYDCGSDKRVYFFSMEYVDAESLLSLVTREGRLDPEVAAGYVLQAARGLKFAHDRGMVHRDIKPDNLLLNHNGIVKVADMGLVKRARSLQPVPLDEQETEDNLQHLMEDGPQEATMGTPAYMAPEQVENSAQVDARADIYSLGCTLYHLLTGRPPFMSESVAAIMGMHVMEPPIPPEERVRRVPKALSDAVMRMLAKLPEERFQTMGEVIRTLETFLGIEGASSFSPREEHANLLERCVQGFNRAPWGRRRRWMVAGFSVLSAAAVGLSAWRLGPLPAVAVGSFAFLTWMTSFLVRGLFQKGALFLRFRQFIFQAPVLTWMVWLLLLGGGGYALYRELLLGHAAFLLAGALVCALGFYLLVDREVEAERKPFVDEVEQMLRSMRLRGLEESALRQFVCKYSGEVWESFYEALFGYDAKLQARERWGRNERGLLREKHASWREPLIRAMDAVQHFRQHRRERRQLKVLARKKAKAQASGATPAAFS